GKDQLLAIYRFLVLGIGQMLERLLRAIERTPSALDQLREIGRHERRREFLGAGLALRLMQIFRVSRRQIDDRIVLEHTDALLEAVNHDLHASSLAGFAPVPREV